MLKKMRILVGHNLSKVKSLKIHLWEGLDVFAALQFVTKWIIIPGSVFNVRFLFVTI